jgi:hypothetical protein
MLPALFSILLAPSVFAASPIFFEGFDSYAEAKGHFGDTTNYKLVSDSGRSAALVKGIDSAKSIYLTYSLPLDSVRGSVLSVSASSRAAGFTRPPKASNGVKVMLSVVHSDSTSENPQLPWPDTSRSYPWQGSSMIVTVPGNALKANLVLGLELAAGSVFFDSIRIDRIGSAEQPPARSVTGPIPSAFGANKSRGAMIGVPPTSDALANFGSTWKGNLLRWQMNGHFDLKNVLSQSNYDSLLQAELGYLDQGLPVCKANGIRVVIDMHQMSTGLFLGAAQQKLLLETWKTIAQRYVGNPAVAGYDLANEPDEASWRPGALLWNELADTLCRVIRSVDKTTPIVIEPVQADVQKFAQLQPVGWNRGWDLSNIVYSFHFYTPSTLTAQGVTGNASIGAVYPGTIDGLAYDSTRLRKAMQPAVDFQKRYQVPIYVGEFSCIRWAPEHSALHWLTDVTNILESQGWDWSYHAYREYQGWSVEYSDSLADTRSNLDTDRKALLLSLYARNANPSRLRGSVGETRFDLHNLSWQRKDPGTLRVAGIPMGAALEFRGPSGKMEGRISGQAPEIHLEPGVHWCRVTGVVQSGWEAVPQIW